MHYWGRHVCAMEYEPCAALFLGAESDAAHICTGVVKCKHSTVCSAQPRNFHFGCKWPHRFHLSDSLCMLYAYPCTQSSGHGFQNSSFYYCHFWLHGRSLQNCQFDSWSGCKFVPHHSECVFLLQLLRAIIPAQINITLLESWWNCFLSGVDAPDVYARRGTLLGSLHCICLSKATALCRETRVMRENQLISSHRFAEHVKECITSMREGADSVDICAEDWVVPLSRRNQIWLSWKEGAGWWCLEFAFDHDKVGPPSYPWSACCFRNRSFSSRSAACRGSWTIVRPCAVIAPASWTFTSVRMILRNTSHSPQSWWWIWLLLVILIDCVLTWY